MRAKDGVRNYEATRRNYFNFAYRTIQSICETIGPRESGSESERKAQERIIEELGKKIDGSKSSVETSLEDFKMSKYAFMSWVLIDGIFLLLAVLFSFLKIPVVSVVLAAISFMCLFFEFLTYNEFLDPLFPKATSCNAVGVKKPTGEVKQRIIFSGHIDSAYEWSFTQWGGHTMLIGGSVYAILGLLYVLVVTIIQLIKCGPVGGDVEGAVAILRWIELAFVPGFVLVTLFTNYKRPVMGCNDNLTGSLAAVAVIRYLEENDISFENTEVVALTTGCEEAGLRGAKAYVKAHRKELEEVPTVFFGMDTLTEEQYMAIYKRDMTGTVKNDPRVCALMKKGAELAGKDIPFSSVWFGASDAAQVSKMGIPAACLAAMDPTGPRYYHTRRDTMDVLKENRKTLDVSLDICLQSLYLFDEFGLKDNYDEVVVEKAEEAETAE